MGRFVRIANLTRGTSIAERCRVARSLRERTVGLLATPNLAAGEGLLIERTQSIHMFFMRYPIDVAFIDKSGLVRRTVSVLRPWRVVWWARGARDCIELPVGTLSASRTVSGDQVEVAALD
ncbi:MAG: DUF192 domain-containing protein [Chloroflexota bacterium]|nr:DUF192 domain-containing protein [Chloroflexota bacterium]